MGQRIIEVNGQSLLGATHQEAVNILRNAGDEIKLLVCDGFNPDTDTLALGGEPGALYTNFYFQFVIFHFFTNHDSPLLGPK